MKFSPSRTEHTLPDIQIHGLLTIDIPRKKAFFPLETIISTFYFPTVLMVDHDRVSLADIGIVEVPPFKRRSEQQAKHYLDYLRHSI